MLAVLESFAVSSLGVSPLSKKLSSSVCFSLILVKLAVGLPDWDGDKCAVQEELLMENNGQPLCTLKWVSNSDLKPITRSGCPVEGHQLMLLYSLPADAACHLPLTERVLIWVCKQLSYFGLCVVNLSACDNLCLQVLPSASIITSAPPHIIRHWIIIRSIKPRSLMWAIHNKVCASMRI